MRTALLAIAVLIALPAVVAAQPRGDAWQAYHYGSEPNDLALIYGAPLDGGQPYYPGLTCPNRGQIVVHFFLTDAQFPNRRSNGAMVDARGIAGPWTTQVTVSAGSSVTTLPGQIEYDDIGDVIQVRATLPHGSPAAVEFARTGHIVASARGYTTPFPPVPQALRRRLLEYCTGH